MTQVGGGVYTCVSAPLSSFRGHTPKFLLCIPREEESVDHTSKTAKISHNGLVPKVDFSLSGTNQPLKST